MKTLSRILQVAMIASLLAACGNNSSQQAAALAAQQAATAGLQTAAGGCLPLNGSLPFTANGAQMSSTAILAGQFPASSGIGSYGQVVMGGGLATASSIQYQPKVSSNGQIQLQVGGTNQVYGVIQLSQAVTSQIQASYASSYAYGTTNTAATTVCVNSISIWAIQTIVSSGYSGYNTTYAAQQMGTGYINQALVYLTLNNGQVVGPITFY